MAGTRWGSAPFWWFGGGNVEKSKSRNVEIPQSRSVALSLGIVGIGIIARCLVGHGGVGLQQLILAQCARGNGGRWWILNRPD
ncbi:hypothetical protein B7486_12295 [cyanobacterium TDX16]|nr:hypothetical protein B7486_12295 [cyanobacterium TDX16]